MASINPSQSETDRRAAVDDALSRAEQFRREQRYEEGIDLLLEALAHGLDKAQIYYRLGNIYYDQGDNERAEYTFRKAITHDPNHINAHHNLGVVYRNEGRVRESIQMRKKAQRMARRHPDRVTITPEQAKFARKFAIRWFLGGLLILVGLVGLIVLIASLV
ncbi:MAG: tetratricopeptide repeat protein [Candidatus Bipolaricaulia bacterium]